MVMLELLRNTSRLMVMLELLRPTSRLLVMRVLIRNTSRLMSMLVPLMVRVVVAKMNVKVSVFLLVFTWRLGGGGGEVVEEVLLAGRTPAAPSSPHSRVRTL